MGGVSIVMGSSPCGIAIATMVTDRERGTREKIIGELLCNVKVLEDERLKR